VGGGTGDFSVSASVSANRSSTIDPLIALKSQVGAQMADAVFRGLAPDTGGYQNQLLRSGSCCTGFGMGGPGQSRPQMTIADFLSSSLSPWPSDRLPTASSSEAYRAGRVRDELTAIAPELGDRLWLMGDDRLKNVDVARVAGRISDDVSGGLSPQEKTRLMADIASGKYDKSNDPSYDNNDDAYARDQTAKSDFLGRLEARTFGIRGAGQLIEALRVLPAGDFSNVKLNDLVDRIDRNSQNGRGSLSLPEIRDIVGNIGPRASR
jgi:hypothetical protein